MIRTIKTEIARADRFWSLREDLHARFDALVEPHLVDGVLDSVAVDFDREGGLGAFRKVLVEREVVEQLEYLAEGDNALNYTMDMELSRAA
ncbi:three-helix bundle dimerization domain-containing protein [Corynebacterium halotolerans]|uniref:three-helix bundle dimerization domain-containing protein n=1 Tax=Corynebacterium halotolerans TaxID=225326 RepID=UPI003CF1563D